MELSFNQLPLCHLLHEALSEQRSRHERITCLLAACVLQLMSSKSLELLFRDRAMLDKCRGKMDWLWNLVEAPKFLQTFLTSAGKHDMFCTLFSMSGQWMGAEVPGCEKHEDLRNLDGQLFVDFARAVLPGSVSAEVVGWLLSEMMQLTQNLLNEALGSTDWMGYHETCTLAEQDVATLDPASMLRFLRSQFCLELWCETSHLRTQSTNLAESISLPGSRR